MTRSSEYQRFLDFMAGRILDEIPRHKEVPAKPQDIGWVEQRQVQRARHHKLIGARMTYEELRYHRRKRPDIVISDEVMIRAYRKQYG